MKGDFFMNKKEIMKKVDHTILAVGTTFDDVKYLIDDGIKYGAYSVCISPCFVKDAKDYAKDKIKICTVIGFPSGNHAPGVKGLEALQAINDGADELDMVINVGYVKERNFDAVLDEIRLVRNIADEVVLKVIIETALLEEDEIIKMCEIVNKAGADYIKTSTGFSTRGATFRDVEIMKKAIDELGCNLKIKAAGGIKTFDDAEKFIELGADRLGTSRLVKLLK